MLSKPSILPFVSSAFALYATSALAHAHLQKSTPAAGETVKISPTEIRLKFSEGVEPRFSTIALVAQSGVSASIDKPSVDPADHSVLIAPVAQALKPGVYRVTWHAVSTDTHKTEGVFTFTIAP
jgi:methionine-rich copper-binding protein CopC